jgi:hypothetical protein
MCNSFVLPLAPTIICVSHSGTGTFSGDHCGFFLPMGYNLVLRTRAAFLMYPHDSSLFKCAGIFGENAFLGLIISISHRSIFCASTSLLPWWRGRSTCLCYVWG